MGPFKMGSFGGERRVRGGPGARVIRQFYRRAIVCDNAALYIRALGFVATRLKRFLDRFRGSPRNRDEASLGGNCREYASALASAAMDSQVATGLIMLVISVFSVLEKRLEASDPGGLPGPHGSLQLW
jgi:hypothetical protein